MKAHRIPLAILALPALSAQAPPGSPEGPLQLNKEAGAELQTGLRVPFELNSGKIYLDVRLEGEPCSLVLDAGSPGVIVDTALAQRIGLELGDAVQVRGAGEATFPFSPVARPLSATLPGGLVLAELRANSGPIDRVVGPYEGRRIDGVLGVRSLFERRVIEIDYESELLTLHEPGSFVYEGDGHVVPMKVAEGRMIVRGVLRLDEGEPAEAELLLDTGLRGALFLRRPFVEREDLLARVGRTVQTTVGGGVGGQVVCRVGRVPRFELGDASAADLPVWLSDSEQDLSSPSEWGGVLGSAFLQRFRVVFDAPGERLYLEPAALDPSRVELDKSGLFLIAGVEGRDRFRVLDVVPGSPADEAGIRVGDQVEEVDGARNLHLEAIRRHLRGADGTEVRLGLRREGTPLERSLRLRRYI